MVDLPSGTVTFLFTDIEGSTKLWESHPEAMKVTLAQHDSILRTAIEANRGVLIKTTGDGVHGVFERAIDAVKAMLNAQPQFMQPLGELKIKVRMGLHTGEAELRERDYYGQALNRTARIMSIAHGGQMLISSVTAEITREHLPVETTLLDLGKHRLKDLIQPEHIFQLCTRELPANFPMPRSLDTFPNNLPMQLTTFIGREREIDEARNKLHDTRLMTLIGPGGTGKTRLSLQLGAELLPAFKDGVWLIELAPLSDPALIPQSIASVFDIRAQQGMPLTDMVNNYLRAKELLLILDNCEHLIEACARQAEHFLQTSPGIKIIASSREALGISGELIHRVPSLSLPGPGRVTRQTLAESEASRLFIERARAVNAGFDVTEANASSVAQICNRLDGIPLALELAAARSTVFSPEQIASRLDDRFKLLTGGSRTALPRQQTLRALIDWSYDILSEEERTLLRRLSVFAGGWSFEGAEAICAGLDVLDLLPQLVNKSLVVVEQDGATRYRLLETIRQYARDKLLEAGEAAHVRNLHMEYFVTFAERVAPRIDAEEAFQWIPQLDSEYDNFRAAFDWGLNNNIESCLHLVGALSYYWFRRGHGVEGIEMANSALAHTGSLPKPNDEAAARHQKMVRAQALQAASFLCYSQGDNASAHKVGAECIALARELGDVRMLALALSFSGSAKLFEGDFSDAAAEIEEAVTIAREMKEKTGLGIALGMMAQLQMMKNNDIQAAKAYEQQALTLMADGGNSWTKMMLYFGTGRGAMFRGDYATARERFAICLPMFDEMKDEHRANMVYSEFAHMDRYEGKYREAEEAYRKTITVWEKLGHRAAIAHQFESFAFIAIVREQPERAAQLLGAAEALRERINIHMSPPEQLEYQKEVAKLRAGMDENTFASHWAHGRAMKMEDAIALAIN